MEHINYKSKNSKVIYAGNIAANAIQNKAITLQDNRPASIAQKKDNTPLPVKNTLPVVQRWLDPKLITKQNNDKRTKEIALKALNYNSNRKGKTRTMRIDELHVLQVSIMHWLDRFEVPDQNVSNTALSVKELLNDVQLEHTNLVKQSIVQNDLAPPVANFNSLSDPEKKQVKSIWEQLVKGTGNVQITEEENYKSSEIKEGDNNTSRIHVGFRYEVLAQFARLLETATGRDIVGQVNKDTKGKKLITIKPGFAHASQGAGKSEFAAAPTTADSSENLTEITAQVNEMFKGQKNAQQRRKNYKNQFIELDLATIADNKLKAAAIYNARKHNPMAKGIKMNNKYYKFGDGVGANVTITRDIRDAENHHTSRFVDKKHNEIPTPNYITLGHELGHAAHMLGGVSLADSKVSEQLFPEVGVHGREELNWSNMEEFGNIHSVENSIRKEYGMKSRFGHINQSSVQSKLLIKIIGKLFRLCDLQPNNNRAAVANILQKANNFASGMEIREARKTIKNAVTNFVNHMNVAFPQFLPSENDAVKAQSTTFKTNANSAYADVLAQAEANIDQMIVIINTAKQRVQATALAHQPQQPPQKSFLRRLWPF